MQRMTSGLSRSVVRWVSQVTASLGATLAATLIWSAVPHPGAPAPASPPELTSGGKFAARAPLPVAYDGLDEMPLPHVAPAILAEAAPPRRMAPEAAERPTRAARAAKPPLRSEARRLAPADLAPRPAPVEAAFVEPAPEVGLMPGGLPRLLPAVLSTAREAWSLTASAGDALVSRIVPQIP